MHVPDLTRFGYVDFVFCQLNMSHLHNQRLRGMFGVGVRAKKACGKRQMTLSMGLVREFACFLNGYQPKKGLLHFCFNFHTCVDYWLYML